VKKVIKTALRNYLLFENFSNNKFIFSKSSNGELITLYSNNQMVGDIELSYLSDTMEILQLDVLSKFRGKGFAKLLMDKAIKHASKKGLSKIILEPEPMDSNGIDKNGLYDFYSKFGFDKLDNGSMILNFKQSNLNETVDKVIKCKNCDWSWKESESAKEDLYLCHKCGYDNTPKK
jgi:GNAT superfamily N-acetyltransferase